MISPLPPFDLRSSGVLLHVTSLPGPHGSGDLGPAAFAFADYLHRAGQRWWQTLPVGPTGRGDSPYDSESSFAGSPQLVSLQGLVDLGLLMPDELAAPAGLDGSRANHAASRQFRERRLRLAHERFVRRRRRLRTAYEEFQDQARTWLPDYAHYRAVRDECGQPWAEWDPALRDRRAGALERSRQRLASEIDFHSFVQFVFERQWRALRQYGQRRGIRLLGDVPMFVAHDSAEVWSNRELFFMDRSGRCTVVAGVPPDAFSRSGQLWGNPLYRWSTLRKTGYAWWIDRLRATLARFDAVRLDHFIGFQRYWEIPGSARTARSGRYVLVPGADFFAHARDALGGLPFVAEDLGLITPEVEALRDRFQLPGMRVLQFAFDGDEGGKPYLPHRYVRHTVAYTGTHDNDTTVGWYRSRAPRGDGKARDALQRRVARIRAYTGSTGEEVHWDLIRLLMTSVANTTIFPLQDVLGLDSKSRMNVPGTPQSNWRWRVLASQLTRDTADRMRALAEATERA
jgi:4-alpha-glucanotransferase